MGLDSADKVWKKEQTAALIALYESERCLYDKKDKNYHDDQELNDGYERIRQVMLRIRPGCTVSDIKSRIKYLSSQYASELCRRNISIESGFCTEDSYKPVMWCFGLLQFLDDFISTKKNSSKVDTSEEEKSEEAEDENHSTNITSCSKKNSTNRNKEKSEETEDDNQSANITSCSKRNLTNRNKEKSEDTEDDNQSTNITSCSKRNSTNRNDSSRCSDSSVKNGDLEVTVENNSRKKRKIEYPTSSESTMDTPERLSVENSCDREDIFGEYVASEMRALRDNPLLYLQTKQSILEILTSANFELINPE